MLEATGDMDAGVAALLHGTSEADAAHSSMELPDVAKVSERVRLERACPEEP